jgi:hypothetical protein
VRGGAGEGRFAGDRGGGARPYDVTLRNRASGVGRPPCQPAAGGCREPPPSGPRWVWHDVPSGADALHVGHEGSVDVGIVVVDPPDRPVEKLELSVQRRPGLAVVVD